MHVSAQRIFGPHVRFFALRNIPWLCRVVKLGEESAITGAKSSIGVMTSNLSEDWVKQQLEPLFVVQKSGPRGGAKGIFTDFPFASFCFLAWCFFMVFHGCSLSFHGFSMDMPWIFMTFCLVLRRFVRFRWPEEVGARAGAPARLLPRGLQPREPDHSPGQVLGDVPELAGAALRCLRGAAGVALPGHGRAFWVMCKSFRGFWS